MTRRWGSKLAPAKATAFVGTLVLMIAAMTSANGAGAAHASTEPVAASDAGTAAPLGSPTATKRPHGASSRFDSVRRLQDDGIRRSPLSGTNGAIPPPAVGALERTYTESGSEIDLLVLYTKGMKSRYGSRLSSKIDKLVRVANKAMKNSGISTRFRVVGKRRYTAASASERRSPLTAINTIARSSTVAALRSSYRADLVSLLRVDSGAFSFCGVGDIMFEPRAFADSAFTVADIGPECTDRIVAHELGHNLGGEHDRGNNTGSGIFPYSFGYDVRGVFATLMSYDSPQVTFYSTPNKTYRGRAMGRPAGSSRAADNASTFQITRVTAANFRTNALRASPNYKNFGKRAIGTTATKRINVKNRATTPVTIASVRVSGGARHYHILRDFCTGRSVAAGSTCPIRVAFKPTSSGNKYATVIVETDVPSDGRSVARLKGKGFPRLWAKNVSSKMKRAGRGTITGALRSSRGKPIRGAKVHFQKKSGTLYRTIGSAKSNSRGRFTRSVKTSGSTIYRVVRVRTNGGRLYSGDLRVRLR